MASQRIFQSVVTNDLSDEDHINVIQGILKDFANRIKKQYDKEKDYEKSNQM